MMVNTSTIMAEAVMRLSARKLGPKQLYPRLPGNEPTTGHGISLTSDAFYRLMIWLSPAYPVGAFAYSTGIEWAVEAGDITTAETLRVWLESTLTTGTGLNDGIFFAHMHRAMVQNNGSRAKEIMDLSAAFVTSRERYEETTKLGRAFVEVTQAAWPCQALAKLQESADCAITYPVAVGAACAGHAILLEPALHAFLAAVVGNWLSAGMRLIPLGHTDGQRLLRSLEPAVLATAQRALEASLDDLGNACFRADLASMKHETQYTRLFRS
jgi:urease accessory protein